MRLRNLFMILLLCMTVGMFGVSCTGDDGAQGPPGPAGPAGPAGPGADDGDVEIPENTNFYSFLESWGVKDGEVGCSDPVLTGIGPMPGPAMALPAADPTAAVNGLIFSGDCGTNILGNVAASDLTHNGMALVPAATTITAGNIVLVKTGRSAQPEKTVEDSEANTFSLASRTTTTKNFVEGLIFATLGSEAFGLDERDYLHTDCGGETTPPKVKGIWRAAQITKSAQEYEESKPVASTASAPQPVVTVTTKLCVSLDAHPGVTKCFVDINAPADADDEKFIALYDGEKLTKVIVEDATASPAKALTGTTATTITDGGLFAANDIGPESGRSDAASANDVNIKLCSLLEEKDAE